MRKKLVRWERPLIIVVLWLQDLTFNIQTSSMIKKPQLKSTRFLKCYLSLLVRRVLGKKTRTIIYDPLFLLKAQVKSKFVIFWVKIWHSIVTNVVHWFTGEQSTLLQNTAGMHKNFFFPFNEVMELWYMYYLKIQFSLGSSEG